MPTVLERTTGDLALEQLVELARGGDLTFPSIAQVVQTLGLTPEDIGVTLDRLARAGFALPIAVADHRRPSTGPAMPAPRIRLSFLHGDEILDCSSISLRDLGLGRPPPSGVVPVITELPRPAARSRPKPISAGYDETYFDDSVPVRSEPEALDLVRLYRSQASEQALLTADEEVHLARQIEAGLLAQEALQRPGLTSAVVRNLRALDGLGRQAFTTFLRANLRLVVSVTLGHQGRGLDLLDLIQEGNLGLIRAVQKFDFQQGYKFSTYATWWISQALTRAVADQSRTIRYPVHVVERLDKALATARALTDAGKKVDVGAIAAESGLSLDETEHLVNGLPTTVSLDDAVAELGDEGLYDLTYRYQGGAEPRLFGLDPTEIDAAMLQLPEREALVLRLRAGYTQDPMTLEQIGSVLGVTRERIRQIESKAIKRLAATLPCPTRHSTATAGDQRVSTT